MEKTNSIKINTRELWRDFALKTDNIAISENGIEIPGTWTYKYSGPLFIDKTLKIVDIVVDENDIFYIINGNTGNIRVYNKKTSVDRLLGCRPSVLPLETVNPTGLAIDAHNIYIADSAALSTGQTGQNQTPEPSRVYACTRINLQVRWTIGHRKDGTPYSEIKDLKVGAKGTLYLLETNAAKEEQQKNILVKINNSGKIDRELKAHRLQNPTDMALDKNKNIYILDGKTIYVYTKDLDEKETLHLETAVNCLKGLYVDENGQVYVGGEPEAAALENSANPQPGTHISTSYLLENAGNNTNIFMPQKGRGSPRQKGEQTCEKSYTQMVADSGRNLYIVDAKGSELTYFQYKPVTQKNTLKQFQGTYITRKLDSRDIMTRWHRVTIHGRFGKDSRVEGHAYISNRKPHNEKIVKDINESEWQKVFAVNVAKPEREEIDVLFPGDNTGRYLWLRLKLTGDEGEAPRVERMTVYFPRNTYLDYLPAIYKEDKASRQFLERYLSIFQTLFTGLDNTIENLETYFDAGGTPAGFLPWLAAWLAVSLEERWPERKKRAFIKRAVSFFNRRGTAPGMRDFLEFYFERKVYLIENHRFRGESTLIKCRPQQHNACKGESALYFPPDNAKTNVIRATHPNEEGRKAPGNEQKDLLTLLYCKEESRPDFYVVMEGTATPPGQDKTAGIYRHDNETGNYPPVIPGVLYPTGFTHEERRDYLNYVRRVIEEIKPAQTVYRLILLYPCIQLDAHTYLGVNTHLTTSEFRLGNMILTGRDTRLHDDRNINRLGKTPLIEKNIKLI